MGLYLGTFTLTCRRTSAGAGWINPKKGLGAVRNTIKILGITTDRA